MEDLYEEGAVLNDDFEFIDTIDNEGKLAHVELKGERTLTRGGALIRVHKHMEVRFVGGVPEVRTTWYQYQSWRPGRRRDDELQLLRYDQAHEGLAAGVIAQICARIAVWGIALSGRIRHNKRVEGER